MLLFYTKGNHVTLFSSSVAKDSYPNLRVLNAESHFLIVANSRNHVVNLSHHSRKNTKTSPASHLPDNIMHVLNFEYAKACHVFNLTKSYNLKE